MKDISILTSSIFITIAISSSGIGGYAGPGAAIADKSAPPPCDPPAFRQIVQVDEDSLENCCKHLMEDKRRIHYLSMRRLRMSIHLHAVYTHEHYLFFRIQVSNHSNLDFAGDSIRFYIVDRLFLRPSEEMLPVTADKRRQVVRIMPLYTYGDARKVKGRSEEETILVLPRFTLSKRKRLLVVLPDRSGGRTLVMHTGNHPLLTAIPVDL